MADVFIGQVLLVGYTFAPRGFADCNGQLISIATNTALFSLLGTTYGGNGTTNFALPDLRGRVPVHMGTAFGLTTIQLGERAGVENVTILTANLPAHSHTLQAQSGVGSTGVPGSTVVLARTAVDDGTPINSYSSAAANTSLAATSIGNTGSGQPVGIRNPYLGLRYVIATQGIFPARN